MHAGGARRAVSTALVLLAVALASLPAAGDAQAAKVKYFGTIDQPQADPSRAQPTIELLVHLDRKKSGELKPDHVNRITTRNMWFQCSHGQTWYPGTSYEKEFFSYPGVDNHPWGVKKRRFSGTAEDDVEVDRLVAAAIPARAPRLARCACSDPPRPRTPSPRAIAGRSASRRGRSSAFGPDPSAVR